MLREVQTFGDCSTGTLLAPLLLSNPGFCIVEGKNDANPPWSGP